MGEIKEVLVIKKLYKEIYEYINTDTLEGNIKPPYSYSYNVKCIGRNR